MDISKNIYSKRLLLRKIQGDDIGNIFKGLSHPDVIKHYGVSFKTLEATQEQMDWFNDLEKNETGFWWAVCSKDNSVFYGAGGFCDWDKNQKKAEIGFWLLPEYWGNGFMTEAMPMICNHGFQQMDMHRIEGYVESVNMNCKKAMNKLNFTLEGTMRDCEIKNGKFISVDIYAKLKG